MQVVEGVKKDLKNEHLKIDRDFCKRYFLGKSTHLVSVEEMAAAYAKDIAAGNVGLGEFIATRWILKNSDVYGYFEEQLKILTPDFEEIENLDPELSRKLVEESVEQFGATRTYLFSVFNSVVFPLELYEKLRLQAEEETQKAMEHEENIQVEETLQVMQKRHSRELNALNDRHEKKLRGLQRKYLYDTEVLKGQIRKLQKRLDG